MEKAKKRIKELKDRFKCSKASSKGSKRDFLLKNLTRTICHVSY